MEQLIEKKPIHLNITVLGKGMVGKSSLTYRFINYETPQDHDPTIEDKYKVVQEIAGHSVEIEILDTAGQDDYQTMIDIWIRSGDGFLLVFAVDDRESFEELDKRRLKIQAMKGNAPIILVGNKCDLVKERIITENEAKNLAKTWGIPYIETSAITNINCNECFIMLAKQLLKSTIKEVPHLSTKKKNCICC